MKKDIEERKVTDIAVAIVPADDFAWDVYLINLKQVAISNILINCKGFGQRERSTVETTQMRYFIENIAAQTAKKIEPLAVELFDLNHQYWISFQENGFMFDKKYIFVQASLCEENFTMIPLLATKGIMIK